MESKYKVFVDTNVIANWLIPTNAFHSEATNFMRLCFNGTSDERFDFIKLLINSFTILSEDSALFSDAINLGSPDLEDALQIVCAENENVDFIVTENIKDFSLSSVPILSIESAIKKISS